MLNILEKFLLTNDFIGPGELPGIMLLIRIIEGNRIDAFFGQVRLSKG